MVHPRTFSFFSLSFLLYFSGKRVLKQTCAAERRATARVAVLLLWVANRISDTKTWSSMHIFPQFLVPTRKYLQEPRLTRMLWGTSIRMSSKASRTSLSCRPQWLTLSTTRKAVHWLSISGLFPLWISEIATTRRCQNPHYQTQSSLKLYIAMLDSDL